ncbi:hypothetical protein EJ05DRAFT_480314 [Pseudovirgaria hyperparasitica]|uniref:Uncharacterized protein n=1 Tax=Pseudovirgaria hyperparasitica TaxID=470096 RepID=A0A6A6VT07_9PEZI|nr:uncharacterized protein EJ05DRAFT_480314 [Pseudovirgaria hyperparasitica]KAF2753285.1 hypothetical protein EJ05DRAFT_480314 [Pseudovirgaria hyperparasitica]
MSDGGISGGVIAGAVVGAVGGVCLAGLGMFFVWRMRKARSSERLTSGAHTRDPSLHGDQKPVPELQVNEAVSPHQEALVSSTPYYEMPIGKRHENFVKRPAELDTSQAFEMPAEDHCLRK